MRFERLPDGSIRRIRKSKEGPERIHPDQELLAFGCSLKPLSERVRERYLSFEACYAAFYKLWTGSGLWAAPDLSQALDVVQRDMEQLRALLSYYLVEDLRKAAGIEGDFEPNAPAPEHLEPGSGIEPVSLPPDIGPLPTDYRLNAF